MNKLAFLAISVIGAGAIAGSGVGVVSAATSTNTNVGTSGIPRDVFKTERQDAIAKTLNTSTANVEAAHKNHTVDTLIKNAGLTRKTFEEKVKAELTTDLEAKGYSQDQITIALQHKHIHHLRHEMKHDKKTNS